MQLRHLPATSAWSAHATRGVNTRTHAVMTAAAVTVLILLMSISRWVPRRIAVDMAAIIGYLHASTLSADRLQRQAAALAQAQKVSAWCRSTITVNNGQAVTIRGTVLALEPSRTRESPARGADCAVEGASDR